MHAEPGRKILFALTMMALATTHRSASWFASQASRAVMIPPQSWPTTTHLARSSRNSSRMPSMNSDIVSRTSFAPYLGRLSLPPYPGRSTAMRVCELRDEAVTILRQRRQESGKPWNTLVYRRRRHTMTDSPCMKMATFLGVEAFVADLRM